MRDIAAESGMHAGNLYYYFQSKEELLAFCQKDSLDGLAEIAAKVEQLQARSTGSTHSTCSTRSDTRLALLIIGHFVLLNETRPGSTAHLEVEAVSDPWLKEIKQLRDEYETSFHRIILAGQQEGVFRDADPRTITLALLGALNWSAKWYRPHGEKSAVDLGIEFADYLVRGLLEKGKNLSQPIAEQIALVTELTGRPLPDSGNTASAIL